MPVISGISWSAISSATGSPARANSCSRASPAAGPREAINRRAQAGRRARAAARARRGRRAGRAGDRRPADGRDHRDRVPGERPRAASHGEADPAGRARLHGGQPDRARDDARPDRLPPGQAVVSRPRAVSRGERVSGELGALGPEEFSLFRIAGVENSRARPRDPRPVDPLPHTLHLPPHRLGRGRGGAGRGGRVWFAAAERRSATTAGCWSTRPTATWSKRSAAGRGSAPTPTTSPSSAPGLPDFRPPCTRRRRDSTRSWSSGRSPAARRGRARASATSPASPGASAATTSPTARASRRGCSAQTSCSRSEATSLRVAGDEHRVGLADGQEVAARTVVLATGVSWRRLGIPQLER